MTDTTEGKEGKGGVVGNINAIKKFFESGLHGRKVELSELKALSKEEREELGVLCIEADAF